MRRAKPIIIIALCILAVFLRLYRLDTVPPSPSLDEVSIGYNAYSIGKTGMDEYKTPFPLQLRAYDDFRPALYLYPVVATVSIFGLSAFAVRFPSVIFSLVTLFFIYQTALLLGKKYFKSEVISIWALAVSTVSPWHIYISRLGHEVNLGLALFTAGTYAIMYWLVTQKKNGLYWSAIMMALSLYGYQSEKIVLPIFAATIAILFWHKFLTSKLVTIKALVLFVLLAGYAVVLTLSPQGLSRLHGTSAIGEDAPQMQQARDKHARAVTSGDRVGALLTSKYVTAATIVVNNYASHFSPRWLFTGIRRESHKVPDMGLLSWWSGVLFIIGVWYGYQVLPKKLFFLLLAWVLTGPIPASITTQAPHAMRAITMFPAIMVIVGIGAGVFEKNKRSKMFIAGLLVALVLYQGIIFSQQYFGVFPKEQSDSFQYALGDAIKYASDHEDEYVQVRISNNGAAYQSYMFYLFYTKFDPKKYLLMGGTKSGGYAEEHTIGKYFFSDLNNVQTLDAATLYLVDSAHIPTQSRQLQTFSNLDKKSAIVVVTR